MTVKKRVKSLGEKLIPISPEFYDTEKEEDLVAPKAVLLPFNAFLVVSQWIAFCILMWWYSSPANNSPVTSIQVDWDYGKADGYNCTPMMKDRYWSNRFNFDTCMELARQPKISSPAADDDTVIWWTSTAGVKGWIYRPFAHSTIAAPVHEETFGSQYETVAAASAARAKVVADLKTKNTCGIDGGFETRNYDEPDTITAWQIKQYASSGAWTDLSTPAQTAAHSAVCTDYSNDEDKNCKADSCERPDSGTSTQSACTADNGNYEAWNCAWNSPPNCIFGWCEDYGSTGNQGQDLYLKPSSNTYAKPSCYFNHSHPLLENVAKAAGFINGSQMVTKMNDMSSNSLNAEADTARQILKDYDRTKTFTPCEITQAEALAMFKYWYDGGYVCEYAKASAPFGCEGSIKKPISECFSLAYANSLLLYTVFSAMCVKIFFAAKKEPEDETDPKKIKEKPASPSMFGGTPGDRAADRL